MSRLQEMRKRMPRKHYRNSRGNKMKKHWYDYLWIVSLAYLVLGFFNILFAWLGLITMVPFKPKNWCVWCPMGTMTQPICRQQDNGSGISSIV